MPERGLTCDGATANEAGSIGLLGGNRILVAEVIDTLCQPDEALAIRWSGPLRFRTMSGHTAGALALGWFATLLELKTSQMPA
jgi:hypothetical protein